MKPVTIPQEWLLLSTAGMWVGVVFRLSICVCVQRALSAHAHGIFLAEILNKSHHCNFSFYCPAAYPSPCHVTAIPLSCIIAAATGQIEARCLSCEALLFRLKL